MPRGSGKDLCNVRQYNRLHEEAGKQQNDRRDINPTHVRQHIADGPEQRLRHGVERFPNRANKRVLGIDDAEGNQLAHDDTGDNNVGIKGDEIADESEKFDHEAPLWFLY